MKNKVQVECKSCNVRVPEALARELDEFVATLPSDCREVQRKAFNVDYMFEPNERAEVSIISTDSPDKSKEVVIPTGLDLDKYRKSMLVFWNHDYERPVATCEWVKLHGGNQIRAKTLYPEKPADVDTPWFTDEIWAMTKCHPPILRAKSIGFLPIVPAREATAEEIEVNPEWNGCKIWEKTCMIEYSTVSLGVNNESLVIAINQKSVTEAMLKTLGMDMPEMPVQPVESVQRKEYTADEIAKAIAFASKAKAIKKAVKKKPQPTEEEIIAQIMEKINMDRIEDMARKLFKNRGRV